MNRVGILHLITGLGVGGAEKVVFDLARKSDQDFFDIHVMGISNLTTLLPKFEKHHIQISILGMKKNLSSFIHAFRSISSYIKDHKIRVIHAHMTHACFMACGVKLFNPHVKIIFSPHSYNIGAMWRKILVYLCRSFRKTDILFAEDMKKFYHKRNSTVIHNGIELTEYKKNVPKFSKFTILTIGRLEAVKNHEDLLENIARVPSHFNFQLLIAGEGVLRPQLEKKIADLGIGHRVTLLGMRNDIPELCNKSHLFILNSLWEGLPISILEAGASKIPVLSTPVGSIPNMLSEDCGILFPKGQSSQAIASAISDYEKLGKYSDNLFRKIESSYSLQAVIKSHENLYKSVINHNA